MKVFASFLARAVFNKIDFEGLHGGSKFLHLITRNKRYLSGSIYRLVGAMVTLRLLYCLHNNAEVSSVSEVVCFGRILFLVAKASERR